MVINGVSYDHREVPKDPSQSTLFRYSFSGSIVQSPLELSISPSVLDFGQADFDPAKGYAPMPAAQQVTVTNTGGGYVNMTTPFLENYRIDAADGGLLLRTLAPGDSITYSVRPFTDGVGNFDATLAFPSKEGVSASVDLRFSIGKAGAGTERSYDFGEVVEGSIPANATITVPVTNQTNQTIFLQEPYFSNDLWQIIIGPLSKTTLAPGETATFDLTVRPTSKQGSYNGNITLQDTADNIVLRTGGRVTVLAPGSTPTDPFVPSQPDQPTPPEAPAEQPTAWAQADVAAAVAANLVPEALQAKYTQTITRAEFCALADSLYTAAKGAAAPVDAGISFTDTSDPAILRMASAKVVNGVGGGTFNPNGQLTREQAAAMLSRLAEALGKPLTGQSATFADMGSVSAYALDPVGQMQATKIMSGVGDNTFAPQNPYTREQSIVTILRLYNTVK